LHGANATTGPAFAARRDRLPRLLEEQRQAKRLFPSMPLRGESLTARAA
jgi:hypothetical protein